MQHGKEDHNRIGLECTFINTCGVLEEGEAGGARVLELFEVSRELEVGNGTEADGEDVEEMRQRLTIFQKLNKYNVMVPWYLGGGGGRNTEEEEEQVEHNFYARAKVREAIPEQGTEKRLILIKRKMDNQK